MEAVKRAPSIDLEVLFNCMFLRNATPVAWRGATTVLIHKGGGRKDPMNWRPVSIGSALQRLLHRILANRLKNAISLDANQRGFVNTDGTLANVLILDYYLQSRR